MIKSSHEIKLNDISKNSDYVHIQDENEYYEFCIKRLKLNGSFRNSELVIISPKYLIINKTNENL